MRHIAQPTDEQQTCLPGPLIPITAERKHMKIGVSIVIYQPDLALLQDVVTHLATAVEALPDEVSVHLDIVNNFPGDDSFRLLRNSLSASPLSPRLTLALVDSPGNIGYGAANNLAIFQSADSDYHLVLNPDALLTPDALAKALAYMRQHPDTGLLVPQVLGFDGVIHHLCKRNPSLFDLYLRGFAPGLVKRWFARRMDEYLMLDEDYRQVIKPVPYPSGCFMFFRADLLRKISGFDERFFMYLEDADIGRRILQHAEVAYVPEVVIYHKWARGTHNNWRLRWVTVASAVKYYFKWGGIFKGTS